MPIRTGNPLDSNLLAAMVDHTVTLKHVVLVKYQHTGVACALSLQFHPAVVLQIYMIDKDSAALINRRGRPQTILDFPFRCLAVLEKSLISAQGGWIDALNGHAGRK
jgi:hypothetical protein